MIGIGIDTGGTCTDAVIYDFDKREILASGKALTTKQNLEIGIANALDALPPELVEKAGGIALSTTLATNASLENKGARAKLLLIGFQGSLMDHLKEAFASYGMTDMSRFITLEARAEGVFSHPFDPDWEALRAQAPEMFADADSVGIVQVYPRANGGRFELTALKILQETLDVPVTIAYDISSEIDIMKTCAGTLLNAMLIPLVSEFMEAIRHVCARRGLNIPITIILSNGTMVPAETAKQFPVETILCGPAASVVGGSVLAGEDSGLIVDMGGTTTDIAIVRDQIPAPATGGIKIGRWRTMVKGIYVDTIGLGGDSGVKVKDHILSLDVVRSIPLCVLSEEYDSVLPRLELLRSTKDHASPYDLEFYVLLKDIAEKTGYTQEERELCEALRGGPLIISDLAEKLETEKRRLPVARLESDGVIIRSGLTPTDMMLLSGDFHMYDVRASRIAAYYMADLAQCSVEALPGKIYELVQKKMYFALGRVILGQRFPKIKAFEDPEYLAPILEAAYQQAVQRCDDPDHYEKAEGVLELTSRLPLIGVGAPIHVFLPRVAALLGTRAVVPAHAGVANALGAIASRKIASAEIRIQAIYENTVLIGYAVAEEGERVFFDKRRRDDAVAYAQEILERTIHKKAELSGITDPRFEYKIENKNITGTGLIVEIVLTATAE